MLDTLVKFSVPREDPILDQVQGHVDDQLLSSLTASPFLQLMYGLVCSLGSIMKDSLVRFGRTNTCFSVAEGENAHRCLPLVSLPQSRVSDVPV